MADRARACDGKMTIDGAPYAYRVINRAGRVNPIDVSNSEGIPGNPAAAAGPGFASTLPDLRSGEFTVSQAMFVASDNPYEAPILLQEGEYYDLNFFPADLDGTAPSTGTYLCVEVGEQGTVNQGALIPSARFRSDGPYNNPGQ
jgi:hypothetical protein